MLHPALGRSFQGQSGRQRGARCFCAHSTPATALRRPGTACLADGRPPICRRPARSDAVPRPRTMPAPHTPHPTGVPTSTTHLYHPDRLAGRASHHIVPSDIGGDAGRGRCVGRSHGPWWVMPN